MLTNPEVIGYANERRGVALKLTQGFTHVNTVPDKGEINTEFIFKIELSKDVY